MTHGSLFSGIGGFDLAARWMGWENVFHVEKDPFCQKVLAHHFPESQAYDDIRTFDATPFRGRIRVLSGGFPCQPFSSAGERKGTTDDRHLFPEMLRVISEISPDWVVGENVRGLVGWSSGDEDEPRMVFNEIIADLEGAGYEVFPTILPACSVNAPHRRDRIFFCARRVATNPYHTGGRGGFRGVPKENGEVSERHDDAQLGNTSAGDAPNANGTGRQECILPIVPREEAQLDREVVPNGNGSVLQQRHGQRASRGATVEEVGTESHDCARPEERNATDTLGGGRTQDHEREQAEEPEYARACWDRFPTVSPVCGGDDGIPTRLDGITVPKWRRESIKAYGNAVVVPLVYNIFKAIEDNESQGVRTTDA